MSGRMEILTAKTLFVLYVSNGNVVYFNTKNVGGPITSEMF